MVSKAGKLLLKNTIQSLEHQNKRKEEKEMWNQWRNDRTSNDKLLKRKYRDCDQQRRYSDDDIRQSDYKRVKSDDKKPDNYWLKKLMAEEEKHANERWTHNGFKELYSEEFQSNSSSKSSDDEEEDKPKKKRKKKKKKHRHKKHKNKSKK